MSSKQLHVFVFAYFQFCFISWLLSNHPQGSTGQVSDFRSESRVFEPWPWQVRPVWGKQPSLPQLQQEMKLVTYRQGISTRCGILSIVKIHWSLFENNSEYWNAISLKKHTVVSYDTTLSYIFSTPFRCQQLSFQIESFSFIVVACISRLTQATLLCCLSVCLPFDTYIRLSVRHSLLRRQA